VDLVVSLPPDGETTPPSQPDDLIGVTLDGRFQIVARIGRGGVADVYRARQLSAGRDVAVKVITSSSADARAFARFATEASIISRLRHPNTLRLFDYGKMPEEGLFIVTELLEGEPLDSILRRGPLGERRALEIARQIIESLIEAHGQGIIHRDLKPQNIFLERIGDREVVKVLDFGVAKASGLQSFNTAKGAIVGTPAYMSPEQIRGDAIDGRSDVYSLGVMLYECLCGRLPFTADTPIGFLNAHVSDPPAPLAADVSVPTARLIGLLLAKAPSARPANALVVRSMLDDLLATRSTSQASAPTVLVDAPARPSKRNRALIALAITAFAAGIALLGLAPLLHKDGRSSSSIPEANTLYAEGMQAMHDGNWALAHESFMRASKRDPEMAAASLRLALVSFHYDPEGSRRAYEAASQHRAHLGGKERVLFEAVEPLLTRSPADLPELRRRLEAAIDRRPNDPELLTLLGLRTNNPRRRLDLARRAVASDPTYSDGLQLLGWSYVSLGEDANAIDAYERCADIAPTSVDCLQDEARLLVARGRCQEAERTSRRAIARYPGAVAYRVLALSLFAQGRSEGAVGAALEMASAARRRNSALWEDGRALLAGAKGDFERARKVIKDHFAAHERETAAEGQYEDAWFLLDALLEMGEEAGAANAAKAYLDRYEVWTRGSSVGDDPDPTPLMLSIAVRAHQISSEERERRLEAWRRDRSSHSPFSTWLYGSAIPADSKESAEAALSTRTSSSVDSALGLLPFAESYIGHVYLLAGHPRESLPHLEAAVQSCASLGHPFALTRAALDLGRAKEALQDLRGACSAYQRVLDRWGDAKPRSVTAAEARARRTALSCPSG
jgi:serine/threonine-protein kinase